MFNVVLSSLHVYFTLTFKPFLLLTALVCALAVQWFSLHDSPFVGDSGYEMSHAELLCPSLLLLRQYSSVVRCLDTHVLSLDLSVFGYG